MSIDDGLIQAWLAARSHARGLPAPVADHGGWRVESALPEERRRYLFSQPKPGLRHLGEAIDEPFVALKLCADGDGLLAQLPPRWRIVSASGTCVMVVEGGWAPEAAVPPGYRIEIEAGDSVHTVRILAGDVVAARGYAAALDGVFVYDRIATDPAHRHRGLGRALMAALATLRPPGTREVLTASPAGAALYRKLGWRDYCPYSTALVAP